MHWKPLSAIRHRLFEIIVLDNASTDDTGKIISEIKNKFPQAEITYLKKDFNYGTNGLRWLS